MTSQTGMTMVYCCHHPYHEMVLYLPNARVTIPVLLTLGQLPHVRQPGWGELAGSQRLTQGNLNSLDPSPQHTFLLGESNKQSRQLLAVQQRHLKQQCYNHGEAQSTHLPLLQSRARFCGAHRSKPPHAAPRAAREERQPPLPLPSLRHFRSSGGRHRPAGCTRGLFSSEHIHGESSRTWQTGGVWLVGGDATCGNVPKSQLGRLRWCLSQRKRQAESYTGTRVLGSIGKAFWGKRCYWCKVKPCEYWFCSFH